MIKVAIVDECPILREGLKRIVESAGDMTVVHEGGSAGEFLEKARKSHFDVALLDISLPDGGGLHLLETIRKRNAKSVVLILSIFSEDQYAERALRLGAAGYLDKHSTPDELRAAIRQAVKGEKYISPALAQKLASHLDESFEKLSHERLSRREFQVFRLLSGGKSVKQIACELGLAASTISTMRANMLKKMRMKTNADLVRYAVGNDMQL